MAAIASPASFDLACAVGAMADAAGHTPAPSRQRAHFAPSGVSTPARLGFNTPKPLTTPRPFSTPKPKTRPPDDAETLTKFFRARSANLDSPIFERRIQEDSRYAQCEPEIRLCSQWKESSEVPPMLNPEIAGEGTFGRDGLQMQGTFDLHWRASRVPLPYAIRIAFNAKAKVVPVRAYLKFETTSATHMYMLVESDVLDIHTMSADAGSGSDVVAAAPTQTSSDDHSWDHLSGMSPAAKLSPSDFFLSSSAPSEPNMQDSHDDHEVQVQKEENVQDEEVEEEFLLTFWAAPCLELRRGSSTLMLTVVDSESRAHEAEFTVTAKGTKAQLAIKAPGFDADAQRTSTKVVFDKNDLVAEQTIQLYNETPNGAPVLAAVYLEESASGAFSIRSEDDEDVGETGVIFTIPSNTPYTVKVGFDLPSDGKVPLCYYGYAVIRLAYFLSDQERYDDEIPEYYDHVVFLEAPRAEGAAIEASPDTPKAQWGTHKQEAVLDAGLSDPASSAGRVVTAPSAPQTLQPVQLPMPLESPAPPQFQFSDSVQFSEHSMHAQQALFESGPATPAPPQVEEGEIVEDHYNFEGEDENGEEDEEDENDICRDFNPAKSAEKWLADDPLLPKHAFHLPGFSEQEPDVEQNPLSPDLNHISSNWSPPPYGDNQGTDAGSRLIASNLYFAEENTPKYMHGDEEGDLIKSRYRDSIGNDSAPIGTLQQYDEQPPQQPAPGPPESTFAQYETCDEDPAKRRESPTDITNSSMASPPKLRMPRGVRTRGVRISGSAEFGSLPLQNASSLPVTVRLGLRGAGCNKLAVLESRYLEIPPGERKKVEISRISAAGGTAAIHLSCAPVGARGAQCEVAYKVTLCVEPAQRRPRPRKKVIVDRPTLSFYAPAESGNVSTIRVFNGTTDKVTVEARVRDVTMSPATAAARERLANPFSFASAEVAELHAGEVHVLRVKYAPNEVRAANPATHYTGFLDVLSAGLRDTIPLFGYSGVSRIKCSWHDGYIRAWNEGSRAGYLQLDDDAVRGVVIMPREVVNVQYSQKWTGLLRVGDEIERSRLREAIMRGVVSPAERKELGRYIEEFHGEKSAGEAEDLRWGSVCDISLHYAARLFLAGIVRCAPREDGEFEERRDGVKEQWSAHWNDQGDVHIVNGSPGMPLRFRAHGAGPASGTLPELGDAVLTPFADVVEIFARGRTVRLRR